MDTTGHRASVEIRLMIKPSSRMTQATQLELERSLHRAGQFIKFIEKQSNTAQQEIRFNVFLSFAAGVAPNEIKATISRTYLVQKILSL
jgi:hypothetical protein